MNTGNNTLDIDSVIRVPRSETKSFYWYWLSFLRPFHGLTDRETDIAAALLKHRQLLSEKIKDDDILDKVLFSEETKKAIVEELGVSPQHYQVLLTKLKLKSIIVEGKMNKKFIPNIDIDKDGFKLLLYFEV